MPGWPFSDSGFLISLGLWLLAFVIAIDVHEFSHALVAQAQGDVTAKQLGRLSLNPLRHLDLMGTVLLLIMVVAGFGFGWGKPVPVNPANLRNGRRSMAMVALAGVTANLVTAILCGVLIRSVAPPDAIVQLFLRALLAISISLAVFNLLPIFPLDGFNVVVNVLPDSWGARMAKYAQWGPGILMLLIFVPQLLPAQLFPGANHINVLGYVLGPPITFLSHAILGG